MSIDGNDRIAAIRRRIGVDLRAAILAHLERCAGLDRGLVELDVRHCVPRRVRQRRAKTAIAHDAQSATALDPPSARNRVGCVGVIRIGQDQRASSDLPNRVRAGDC